MEARMYAHIHIVLARVRYEENRPAHLVSHTRDKQLQVRRMEGILQGEREREKYYTHPATQGCSTYHCPGVNTPTPSLRGESTGPRVAAPPAPAAGRHCAPAPPPGHRPRPASARPAAQPSPPQARDRPRAGRRARGGAQLAAPLGGRMVRRGGRSSPSPSCCGCRTCY